MSSQPETLFASDLDSSPLLLPAKILRNDAEALQAAHELAQVARQQAARRDQQRKLPWAEIELFTRSGLGSISIPKAFGGPDVSFETVAEVFRIISAADPALGQIPQNQFGMLQLLRLTASEAQQALIFRSVLDGWRIGNAGPERGSKDTLTLKARISRDGEGYRISGEKFYSTGALFAHWVAVKALDDEGASAWHSCAVAALACVSSTTGPALANAPRPAARCCSTRCRWTRNWSSTTGVSATCRTSRAQLRS